MFKEGLEFDWQGAMEKAQFVLAAGFGLHLRLGVQTIVVMAFRTKTSEGLFQLNEASWHVPRLQAITLIVL